MTKDVIHKKRLKCETLTNETSSPEVSVVMPCLNERDTLATCIEKAQGALREHNIIGEIIVADNGISDNSQEIASRMGARVIPVEGKGLGEGAYGRFRLRT